MELRDGAPVTGRNGLQGRLDLRGHSGDDGQVLLALEDGRQVLLPASVLVPYGDGSYAVPLAPEDLRRADGATTAATGQAATVQAAQTAGSAHTVQAASAGVREQETLVVPVLEEHLQVGKRRVEGGGVRVSTVVHEREVVVDQPLHREEVDVERVPIGRVVDQPTAPRQEGDVLIIPLYEEVLLVEKRLMLKEEVRISRRQFEAREPQRVVLRTEEARVERLDPHDRVEGGERNAA